MNFTRMRVIQKIVAVLIILIMTLADFSLIGANVISYALDMAQTNSNNVEFSAYFVNDAKEKITEIDSNIGVQDLKLFVEISVKNEGYFDGAITLGDSSFSFTKNFDSEYVKELKENTVTLNRISAGATATIELGVIYNNANEITLASLNQDNTINLTGKYKNSEKDIDIEGTTTVKVNWKSPTDIGANLETKLLTNSIYEIEEGEAKANKRVVQLLVNSKLINNSYPVEKTIINLDVPNGADKVKVHSRSTYATNGNDSFSQDNYIYDAENGTVTITLKNDTQDGKINWNKNVEDTLVVTYVYPETTTFNLEKINGNVSITTYDGQEFKASKTTIVSDSDSHHGIVTVDIFQNEDFIYKGKLYTGEKRDYISTTVLNIDYAELVAEDIRLFHGTYYKDSQFEDDPYKDINIQYIETKIEKAKFDQIFGKDGYITIKDQDDNTIANINKDTEVTAGNIVVKYNAGIKGITIKTSKPISNGIIDFVHTKSISDTGFTREQINSIDKIYEHISINTKLGTMGISAPKFFPFELKETSSKANVTITPKTLSTVSKNENVEIVATLETNDESKDLYKNPTVQVVFPKEIKEVTVDKATALYRNGLEVDSTSQEKNDDGNIVLTVKFKGEQTKYDSEILNGLELHFKATIEVSKTTPSKSVSLKMKYTNENGSEDSYEVKTPIQLESQYGLLLYNKLEKYNSNGDTVETIDENKQNVVLNISEENVMPEVTTMLINNYDKKIENVVILGNLTSEQNKDTFDSIIASLNVNNDNAKIYYSKVANAKANDTSWTEDIKDAKAYKIAIDSIDAGATVKLTYKLDIEDKLTYNMLSNLITSVTFNYGDNVLTENSTIVLLTEEGIIEDELEGDKIATDSGFVFNVAAVSGNKELDGKDNNSIFNGETIKYIVKIRNNTGKDYKDLTIKATQTNGLIFDLVEIEGFNPIAGKVKEHYWKATDTNIKEFTKIDIKNGETVTLQYQVVTNKIEGNETYASLSLLSSDNNELESVQTEKYNIKDAELKLIFTPADSEECIWTTDSVQQSNLFITNTTQADLTNVEVKIILSKGLNCDKYENYIDWDTDNINAEIKDKEVNSLGQTIITLKISKIASEGNVGIYVSPYISETDQKTKEFVLYATATTESSNTYSSNNIVREATQVNKQIEVEQTAKINGKTATKKSIINDGDKLDFYITVKNKDEEDAKLSIFDYLQQGLTVNSITFVENSGSKTDITDKYKEQALYNEFELKSGEEVTVIISTKVNAIYMIEQKSVINKVDVSDLNTTEVYSNSIELSVDTEEFEYHEPEKPTPEPTPDPEPTPNPEPTPDPETPKYTVNGFAWIDSNKNGARDDGEELIRDVEVKAINTETEEVLSTDARTTEEGSYKLILPEGKYIIIFMYDNENYYVTTYQANGVSNEVNSDVVTKTLNLNNKEVTVGTTDVINLSENKNNIDIGLIYRNKFDLKLEKTISKIVVTNNGGISEYNFDDLQLAKVEIAAKYLSGSTVVVEYKIKVTNVGDIDGYVKNIVDYMPSDMTFSSTLNKDWYQSDKYLYNESIANKKITPGESYEVDLILTKNMTESNTGLVNNTAAIKSSYNEKSFSDANTDNNKGLADVIISVKTGAAIRLALLTLSLTTIIAVIAYYVTKKYISKKI